MRPENTENAEYYLPGVIYEAGEHGMRIYAYKENVPGPDTVLYAAPFFNVTGSSVCLGNARIELPGDKGGTGQGLQPRRTEATEQHET